MSDRTKYWALRLCSVIPIAIAFEMHLTGEWPIIKWLVAALGLVMAEGSGEILCRIEIRENLN